MRDRASAASSAPPDALTLLVPGARHEEVREVPLRYLARGADVFVVAPANPLPSWVETLQTEGKARWQIGDRQFSGRAMPVAGDAGSTSDLVAELARAYGRERVLSWYGSAPVAFQLVAERIHTLGDTDLLEAHFDRLAADYDEQVRENPLDAALRESSVRALRQAYRPGHRVLEIGCGTGIETLALAREGIDVVALDVSQGMLDRLRVKAQSEGLLAHIMPRKLRASELGDLIPEFGHAAFQGAFSDFGALNLEPKLGGIPRALADLVAPGGKLVFGIWIRVCLAEMTLYAIGLRPRRAFARLESPVPVGLSRFGLPAYPQSPGPFLAAFRPAFTIERVEALPFLVPPYDFLPHVPRPVRVLPLLESLDRPLRPRFPFNRLGDHFLATLRRV